MGRPQALAVGGLAEPPTRRLPPGWARQLRVGAVTPSQLTQNRGYVLLAAFVVGMILTPPDILSQTLLAVPLYLLFEGGVVMARILVPGYKEVEAQRRQLTGSIKHDR